MCGRFYVDPDNDEIRYILTGIRKDQRVLPVKTGELFPTDIAPVLVRSSEGTAARPMAWGFPKWDGKGVVFNARTETVLEKAMFKNALVRRPAIVPATGFYEWKEIPGQKRKARYLFTDPEHPVLYLAAFFSTFPAKDGFPIEHFTILTTAANGSMAPYHGRMPVLLRYDEQQEWLGGGRLQGFLRRVPFALKVTPS